MPRSVRRKAQSGSTLIEAMMSLAILAIGILGVAQIQVLASTQNGAGRRTSIAASIARDFVETAQRWDFNDPRLQGHGCGTDLTASFPIGDDLVGTEKVPTVALDYTASSGSSASAEGTTGSALSLGIYDGMAADLLSSDAGAVYQLMWSVRDINPSDLAANDDCTAKLVSVVVRYPVGQNRYSNVVATTMIYDPAQITLGGLPERI